MKSLLRPRIARGVLLLSAAVTASGPARAQEPPASAPAPAEPGVEALKRQLEAAIAEQRRKLEQMDEKIAALGLRGSAPSDLRDKLASQEKQIEALRGDFQLQAALGGKDAGAEEKLRVYGFMDMGFQYLTFAEGGVASGAIQSQAPTFVMGNINLYVDAHPFERWRGLFEVRFTNYPDGSSRLPALGQPFTRTSTTVYDVTSPSGGWSQIQYGSIVLERAFIEWAATNWLTVRLGYWPTPYGIWNVDHGTPTRISLGEPQFIIADAFPSKQTGLDLTGTVRLAPWELEYHAYVSNGRTPGQLSLTNGKALGARLVLRRRLPFPVALGASGYYGRFADVHTSLVPGTLVVAPDQDIAYHETGFAADVSLDLKPIRFRSELVLNQRRYDDAAHAPSSLGIGDLPSQTFWGAYSLVAWRLPWAGLEPYTYAELDRNLVPSAQGAGSLSGGLNVHVTAGVQVKLQYTRLKLFDFDTIHRPLGSTAVSFLATRVVMAF